MYQKADMPQIKMDYSWELSVTETFLFLTILKHYTKQSKHNSTFIIITITNVTMAHVFSTHQKITYQQYFEFHVGWK